jgi:hypothetical protein
MKDVDYYRDKSRALDFEVKRLKEKNWWVEYICCIYFF